MKMQGQQLFTVEQIELIRRLKNSGINKDQLAQAFDSMDRLDRELGNVYTIPMSVAQGLQLQQLQQMQLAALLPQTLLANAAAGMNGHIKTPNGPSVSSMSLPVAPPKPPSQPSPTLSINGGGGMWSTPPNLGGGIKRSLDTDGDSEDGSNVIIPAIEEVTEECDEFRDFVVKGEQAMYEEIRNFVGHFTIKQQQVAALSGMSQSYVSRYLKGDYNDMSDRSKRAIYKWYLTYKQFPHFIKHAANAAMLSGSNTPPKKVMHMDPSIQSASDFICYPKRERFVFRPNHLEILEKYFQEDSYPSAEKRDEITRLCNMAGEQAARAAGRELSDREKVTPQVIANWFANKRKELKKIAREEGIPGLSIPFRGKGRPPRFLPYAMDLTMPTMVHDFSRPGSSPNTPLTPHGHRNMDHDAGTSDDGSSNHSGEPSDDSPVRVENGNGSSTPTPEDEQSLQLAVEVAAVNQAILALSGQQPISASANNSAVALTVKKEPPTTITESPEEFKDTENKENTA